MGDQISCSPPRAGASPFRFFNFKIRSVAVTTACGGFTAVFPLAQLVGTINFGGMKVGLISLTLSTSLLNQVPGDTVGVFVALNVGPQISVQGAGDIFLSHLVRQNATAAQRFASSRSNAMVMGQDSLYPIESNVQIGLYACSAANAGNEISAILSAYWTPIPPGF